jgi:hypothetical protein
MAVPVKVTSPIAKKKRKGIKNFLGDMVSQDWGVVVYKKIGVATRGL